MSKQVKKDKAKLTPEQAQDRKKAFVKIIQEIHADMDKQKEAFIKKATKLLKPLPVDITVEGEALNTGIIFSIPECEEVIGYRFNYSDYIGEDFFEKIIKKLSNPDDLCEIAVKVYSQSLSDISESMKQHKEQYDKYCEQSIDAIVSEDIECLSPSASAFLYRHGNALYRLAKIKQEYINKYCPMLGEILVKHGKV